MAISDSVREDFYDWADEALAQKISARTAAFYFNLYEGMESVHVQIVGTESFSEDGEYGQDDETFSTGEDIFEVPFADAGAEWPEWLENVKQLVSGYIDAGKKAAVLRNSQGIGIGFVDGDLEVLWRRTS
jgi:hypothetical protein